MFIRKIFFIKLLDQCSFKLTKILTTCVEMDQNWMLNVSRCFLFRYINSIQWKFLFPHALSKFKTI